MGPSSRLPPHPSSSQQHHHQQHHRRSASPSSQLYAPFHHHGNGTSSSKSRKSGVRKDSPSRQQSPSRHHHPHHPHHQHNHHRTGERARSRERSNPNHRRSRSSPNHQQQQQQLQHQHAPPQHRPKSPYLYADDNSRGVSSSTSEEFSTQSTPSHNTKWSYPYHSERREPSSSSVVSQTSSSFLGSDPLGRDSSPDRSQDSEKQYIRTTRRIVDDLSRAQGAGKRVAAVTSACEAFDHHDEPRHNIELYHGTVQVLAKMLEHPVSDDELRMICSALEMVFRGSPKSVQTAFQRTSGSFLSRLLRLLDRCEERNVKHADISILNITKIIFYLSKCPDLRVGLCRHPDMIDFLARVATRVLNPDCRALRLRLLANLAIADKNKVIIYEQKSIVDSLLRIAHMDSFDLARQHAAVVLQELSASSFNHISIASNDQFLGTLVKMALAEKSLLARDAVISALQTLAFTKQNRKRLVTFKDGIVLEALKRTLSVDPDDKIRRRAAGTLTNLACDETAKRMGNHEGLLEALAIISTKDYNTDVQMRAALALTKIGSSINRDMNCFTTLLDALVVASLSKSSNSVTAVLRLKAREPANRVIMAQHAGVLDTLCDICVSPASSPSDRDNAMRALMHLINDDKNRTFMCNKRVLHTLVTGANYEEESLSESRESAIIGLERMATDTDNRGYMARHPGLLQAVSKAVEREVKLEDSKIESEHGYLAKPLLMSLLLAM